MMTEEEHQAAISPSSPLLRRDSLPISQSVNNRLYEESVSQTALGGPKSYALLRCYVGLSELGWRTDLCIGLPTMQIKSWKTFRERSR